MIVVTVNYRVNVFGFPGAPGKPRNLGIRDQRLALEWVRDNIVAFGGDSSRIVMFGQSAGAAAVDLHTYAWKNDPIAYALASHSGNALSFPLDSPETAAAHWANLTNLLGLNASQDVWQDIKRLDWEQIKDAAAKVQSRIEDSPVRSVPPFQPSWDNEIVFEDYVTLSDEGSFAQIVSATC